MDIPTDVSRKSVKECIFYKRLNDELGHKKLQAVLSYFIMNTDLFTVSDLINEHIVLKCFNFSLHRYHIFS
ncbi:hypothetical protein D3C73_1564290 [compost metagenome]